MFAKKMTPERVDVRILEQRLEVVICSPEGEEEYQLGIDLYDRVVPADSKFTLLGTKVRVAPAAKGATACFRVES